MNQLQNHESEVDPIQPSAMLQPQGEMGLMEHLTELRKRILFALYGIMLATCVTYSYSQFVFTILNQPVTIAFPNAQLIGTGPAEAFIIRIKVALFSGIILASPWIFFQLWKFVAPGLYPSERKLALPFVFVASSLFACGAAFCHEIMLPLSYGFFAGEYQNIGVTPQIRIGEHLSMVIMTVLGFGAAFELPVIVFLLGRAGIVTDKMLIEAGRYAIVAIFIIAAVLTPPDVLSQMLMAGPLLILYAISIGVLKLTQRKSTENS